MEQELLNKANSIRDAINGIDRQLGYIVNPKVKIYHDEYTHNYISEEALKAIKLMATNDLQAQRAALESDFKNL